MRGLLLITALLVIIPETCQSRESDTFHINGQLELDRVATEQLSNTSVNTIIIHCNSTWTEIHFNKSFLTANIYRLIFNGYNSLNNKVSGLHNLDTRRWIEFNGDSGSVFKTDEPLTNVGRLDIMGFDSVFIKHKLVTRVIYIDLAHVYSDSFFYFCRFKALSSLDSLTQRLEMYPWFHSLKSNNLAEFDKVPSIGFYDLTETETFMLLNAFLSNISLSQNVWISSYEILMYKGSAFKVKPIEQEEGVDTSSVILYSDYSCNRLFQTIGDINFSYLEINTSSDELPSKEALSLLNTNSVYLINMSAKYTRRSRKTLRNKETLCFSYKKKQLLRYIDRKNLNIQFK